MPPRPAGERALVDLRNPSGDPAVVGPDVVASPGDALEPVEEPGGLDRLEPDLRPHRLDLAPRDVDRAVLQPPPEGLAHPDLALPVGSPVSPLSDDHRTPFSTGASEKVCVPFRKKLSYKSLNVARASRDHTCGALSMVLTLPLAATPEQR